MSNIPTGLSTIPETERRRATPAYRCKVTHCWHGAVEDGLCLGHVAEAYQHASHGCPDGICEICETTQEPIA